MIPGRHHTFAAQCRFLLIRKAHKLRCLFLLRCRARKNLVYGCDDLVDPADTQHRVYLRHFGQHLLPVPLGETSRHDQSLESVVFLQPRNV